MKKSGKPTVNLARERLLCIEVYKTLNSLNPFFMQELFKLSETSRNVRNKGKLNLDIPVVNQVTYGTKSFRSFRPKIWNSLPHYVKSAENLEAFKNLLIVGIACLVTVLLVLCLLDIYYSSRFLFIVIFAWVYMYIHIFFMHIL